MLVACCFQGLMFNILQTLKNHRACFHLVLFVRHVLSFEFGLIVRNQNKQRRIRYQAQVSSAMNAQNLTVNSYVINPDGCTIGKCSIT